jgi:hypothetical protein
MILKYVLHAIRLERIAACLSSAWTWVSLRFSVSLRANVVMVAEVRHLRTIKSSTGSAAIRATSRASVEPSACPNGKDILVALRRWRALPATRRTPARGKMRCTLNDSARFSKSDTPARSISTRWGRAMGREKVVAVEAREILLFVFENELNLCWFGGYVFGAPNRRGFKRSASKNEVHLETGSRNHSY